MVLKGRQEGTVLADVEASETEVVTRGGKERGGGGRGWGSQDELEILRVEL